MTDDTTGPDAGDAGEAAEPAEPAEPAGRPPGESRVVLITGCSSGFGLLAAVSFARLGFRVFATMRDPDRADALHAAAAEAGTSVEVVALDVADAASVEAAVAEVIAAAGAPDIVVNNAGIEIVGAIHLLSDTEVHRQLDTNVTGVVRVVRAVAQHMVARGSGVIVNVGSLAGRVGTPYAGLYAASKHALEAISEALHFELSHLGVRVALVEPGQFRTSLGDNRIVAAGMEPGSAEYERWQRWSAAQKGLVGAAGADGDQGAEAAEAAEAAEGQGSGGQDPQLVADTIVAAATTDVPRLRWPVGDDAQMVIAAKDSMSFEDFEAAMREVLDWRE
ncbi:MAG: SDR family NAD(P)-dependent oxidoreductase [Acidimicrobiales bacterium]